jgi:hypothetical protein
VEHKNSLLTFQGIKLLVRQKQLFNTLQKIKVVNCFTFGRSKVLIPNYRPRVPTEILLFSKELFEIIVRIT